MNNEAAHRLQRIVENIRPKTAFTDHYAEPQKLIDRMTQLHTPAVSIAVVDDYRLVATGAFGSHEAVSSRDVTQDTLFLAGSISKSVFATAIMRLHQSGEVDIDHDVNHYLNSWEIPANNGWQPRITLRHLLSHTSGLTVHGFPGYLTNEDIPTLCQILNGEWPANTPKVEVNMLPGLQFRYSGGGITVAQLAMIEHFDEAFPAMMKHLVFEPLGMHNSSFENPLPIELVTSAAVAHPTKNVPLRGEHPVYPESAAAGLWTTPTDLARFGLALQDALRGGNTEFLQKSTIEAMLSPQLAHEENDSNYAGLGFFCDNKDEHVTFGHGGWDEGFVAELKFCRNTGKGAVVMLNSNEGYPLIDEIMRAIAEEIDWAQSPDDRSTIQLSHLETYVGQYKTENSILFSVDRTEGGLLLQYDTQPPVLFEAASKSRFISRVLNTQLTFDSDEDGAVTALTVQQEGIRFRAAKLHS